MIPHNNNPSDRSITKSSTNSLLLLLIWVILGVILRWTNLALKPASSIEIATIGYSLGHGFNQIPLDQLIPLETLLAPLSLDPGIGFWEVLNRLTLESTHPPLYFWLSHWWFNLWLNKGDLVSLEIARSLSACFGILAIPASYLLARISFPSRLVAHLAALLMAISPYGIYLAQSARHYTLTLLWVIVSLICLVKSLKLIEQKITVPIWLGLVWIVINALAIATHYFFVLALGAEAIAILVYWWFNRHQSVVKYGRGLYLAVIGTIASALVWLPMIDGISGNQMTTWIATDYNLPEILLPIPRLIAWMLTMVMLLPIEGTPKIVTIGSGLVILAVLVAIAPTLVRQWRIQLIQPQTRSSMTIIIGYLGSSLLIFMLLIYAMEKDLSLAARYHFVYFPVVILLMAIALATCWHQGLRLAGKKSIMSRLITNTQTRVFAYVLIMGLLGSATVINDFGFQKSRHSDRMAAYVRQNSNLPTIVAMTHYTHSEIRELVALGVSFKSLEPEQIDSSKIPQFLLVSQQQTITEILPTNQQPVNLFGVNLDISDSNLEQIGCKRDKDIDLSDSGYRDRFYVCSE
ncbi:MAG: glycosyltransferase [Cyanobacteria bacterium J06642_3]